MRTKPWPIILLAIMYFLGPIFNTLAGALVMKISYWHYLVSFFKYNSLFDKVAMLTLYPLAGVAIYLCKPWSYPVYLFVMITSFYLNYQDFKHFSNIFTLPIFIMTVIFNVGLVSYFLIPSVRTTYFNRRVRWWESKPRFLIHLPALLDTPEGQKECELLDVSEGGAFIRLQDPLSPENLYTLHFSLFNRPLSIQARIVYRRHEGVAGYGLQFQFKEQEASQYRKLMKGLRLIGIDVRTPAPEWKESLAQWFVQVMKTGKGLVPEIPTQKNAVNCTGETKKEELTDSDRASLN